ncbi:MAG TPA: DUF1552 domain-containing protein [Polyangiaceae bacterium]|nr:DUF1552 domain-containing protein [Polyangiaceae bacterium]
MTKRSTLALSRRQLLGSLGAAAALAPFVPLLNASGQELGRPPKRLLLVFTPDGTAPTIDWMPQGTANDFALRFVHEPLAPLQSKIVIPWGLRMSARGAGEQHAYGMAGQWTGSLLHEPQNGADFDGGNGNRTGWGSGPSIDQVVASAFGPSSPYQTSPDAAELEVPFRTLELGVSSGQPHSLNRMIYRGNEQPLHPEVNPRAAFDRLFTSAVQGADPDAVARVRAEKRAILDIVNTDLNRLRTRIGAEEMRKVEAHAEALRSIERRLDSAALAPACAAPAAPAAERSTNATFPAEITAMSEIVVQALACDLTRVASLQISRGFSHITHTWLGHTSTHHTMSHDNSRDFNPLLEQIDNWYAKQIVALLQRMDAIPEGNGSLLDNTLVVWGRELGTTSHRMDPWPVVLAGSARGELETGRFLQVGSAGSGNSRQREPSAKLLVSIGRLMGLDINSFGNIDADSGPLAGIG